MIGQKFEILKSIKLWLKSIYLLIVHATYYTLNDTTLCSCSCFYNYLTMSAFIQVLHYCRNQMVVIWQKIRWYMKDYQVQHVAQKMIIACSVSGIDVSFFQHCQCQLKEEPSTVARFNLTMSGVVGVGILLLLLKLEYQRKIIIILFFFLEVNIIRLVSITPLTCG